MAKGGGLLSRDRQQNHLPLYVIHSSAAEVFQTTAPNNYANARYLFLADVACCIVEAEFGLPFVLA
jgi:hypothetical protein